MVSDYSLKPLCFRMCVLASEKSGCLSCLHRVMLSPHCVSIGHLIITSWNYLQCVEVNFTEYSIRCQIIVTLLTTASWARLYHLSGTTLFQVKLCKIDIRTFCIAVRPALQFCVQNYSSGQARI